MSWIPCANAKEATKQCNMSSWPARTLRTLGRRPGRRGAEENKDRLKGNPKHAWQDEEGSTLYDFDKTPQAIWSDNREHDYTRQELSSLGITIQKGVRGTHLEEPDFQDIVSSF